MAVALQKYALQLRADDLADGVSAHAEEVQFNRLSFLSTIFLAFTRSAVLKPSSRHFIISVRDLLPPHLGCYFTREPSTNFHPKTHQDRLLMTFTQDIPHINPRYHPNCGSVTPSNPSVTCGTQTNSYSSLLSPKGWRNMTRDECGVDPEESHPNQFKNKKSHLIATTRSEGEGEGANHQP
ncbi:hypothetical protein ASPCAL05896 [Aspergillus calidoustus]|uniref:Uncharacterized protein n=1 Tax=Aspergillus calidoustus TaxID=454130 RepID=A0A0U5FZJ9_ASPCI|nr:hypothetical protein ASPCAL05896 [Aspergillus calidoustus]